VYASLYLHAALKYPYIRVVWMGEPSTAQLQMVDWLKPRMQFSKNGACSQCLAHCFVIPDLSGL
jgi:hypothetical protein